MPIILSTEQKIIVKRIAKKQVTSFLRIVQGKKYEKLLDDLRDEGYSVSEIEVLEQLAKETELWDELIESPETFLSRLDDLNLSVLRHILINEFEVTPETRGIWKKLNLFEKVNSTPN